VPFDKQQTCYDDLVAVIGEDHILAREMRRQGFVRLPAS
jgi:hypothetical protein